MVKTKSQPKQPEKSASKIQVNSDLKAKLEAILFCMPEGVSIQVLAHKVNLGFTSTVKNALQDLQQDYVKREAGLHLLDNGDIWKLRIKDEHTAIVKEAAEPEFEKSVLETLAYIAWRGGSRQCDVVRVRSNKSYTHIKTLIEKGYVESSKSGLSKWLQPTKKFYEYFDMKQGEKLKTPQAFVEAAAELPGVIDINYSE